MRLEASLQRDATAYLADCAKDVPAELYAGSGVRVGTPWQTVCAVARELAVDLVVVGAHGYGETDTILGSTAAKIANHVDRPLLVVRTTPAFEGD